MTITREKKSQRINKCISICIGTAHQVYRLWLSIRIRVLWDNLLTFNLNLEFFFKYLLENDTEICTLFGPKMFFKAYGRVTEFSINFQLTQYSARQHNSISSSFYQLWHRTTSNGFIRARDMAQLLRVVGTLPKDPSSLPRMYCHVSYKSRGITWF